MNLNAKCHLCLHFKSLGDSRQCRQLTPRRRRDEKVKLRLRRRRELSITFTSVLWSLFAEKKNELKRSYELAGATRCCL